MLTVASAQREISALDNMTETELFENLDDDTQQRFRDWFVGTLDTADIGHLIQIVVEGSETSRIIERNVLANKWRNFLATHDLANTFRDELERNIIMGK